MYFCLYKNFYKMVNLDFSHLSIKIVNLIYRYKMVNLDFSHLYKMTKIEIIRAVDDPVNHKKKIELLF